MKAAIALIALMSSMVADAAPPTLPIEQAVKIASDYLREQGLAKQHSITSLVLEPSSMLRKEYHWIALWTPAVDLGNRREIGLQISMDGTAARVVNKPGK
ncbi:MAG: hypothetical protein JWL90_1937 [Chthoniobacteraceae bacterium]|nr:hypothetical protein [Chthoniobacteraceae bacterium]